jgi:hypothetical protein
VSLYPHLGIRSRLPCNLGFGLRRLFEFCRRVAICDRLDSFWNLRTGGLPFRILVILGLILASPILGIRAGVVAVRHVRNWQKWQV